ncbi:TPA: fimbrial protein [Stenotrophomonas maltophilia]|uniref:fimbrial protein n=1 Tax=Stenotrophomonas forensis TaxID=2871169 RepID=UPI002A932098|nr:fimbrial protein [Stenotrophomonas maltophilia]
MKHLPVYSAQAGWKLSAAAGLLACLASAGAMACTGNGVGTANLTADLSSSDTPGTVTLLDGSATWMNNCDVPRPHPLELSLEGLGLTPVSTIDFRGKTYVTYQLSANSPLFFFPINVKIQDPGISGGYELFPSAQGSITPVISYAGSTNSVLTYPYVGVVARHGMQSVPRTQLGTEVVQHTEYPYSIRHSIFVTVNVQQQTCRLSNTGFALPDVTADALQSAGDTSSPRPFSVRMECTAAGVPVKLTLADANDPGATGSVLKPTANATAQGVQVELLSGDGKPVELLRQWDHGVSADGLQYITLGARYLRVPGALKVGAVEGQAVLTAEYR